MIQAVIFNLDGVIIDSMDFTVNSFQEVLKKEKYEIDPDFVASRLGTSPRIVLEDYFSTQNIEKETAYLKKLVASIEAYQYYHASKLQVFRTFPRIIKQFQKYKLALTTMSTRQQTKIKLQKVPFKFPIVLTGDDVAEPKPNPDIYLKASERLGIKPKSCAVIENSLLGVQAAIAAGMKCIGVATGFYSGDALLEVGADMVVPSLKEQEILDFVFNN